MDKLFVIYGKQNAGKTTTLRKVFELLSGHPLNKKDPQPDFRIVFPVGRKWVYMATFGDSESVIQTNFSFFNQTPHGKTIIYEFNGKTFISIDKQRLKEINPDICITACRIYKASVPNLVYQKVNDCILKCMPVPGSIQWIAKSEGKGTRKKNKAINTDYETALNIVTEIMKEAII